MLKKASHWLGHSSRRTLCERHTKLSNSILLSSVPPPVSVAATLMCLSLLLSCGLSHLDQIEVDTGNVDRERVRQQGSGSRITA